MSINLIQCRQTAEAAIAKAVEIGIPMNIAIVDEGANIKFFVRMDNAMLGSADIALKKARTSSLFNRDSGDIGKLSQPGGPLHDIEQTNGGLVSFPGGIVIRDDTGKVIGAIGVSGGTVEQDFQVASAGAAAYKD
ncbi:uncharacterized protein GlcG (DUF336 family) [Mucilaginibacter sp. SG538B]|uniref:GlcG/HbpS family heme-binding protein n=1 Tax=Mucilaginibacter sp. SG538B TaxID=2587021 RepID=UPI00159D82D8|nr:heme-binding protein [Mucilaginibacter sp. SG538B]NVM66722.1 uncharacterized protein GlcG (DUF336 family) [Mucilaginibacter sp. SG538B]